MRGVRRPGRRGPGAGGAGRCRSGRRRGSTITVALGTSTPTSMTVVATSTSIVPARKRSMTASLSAPAMRPCSRPRREPGELAAGHVSSSKVSCGRARLELLGLLDQRAHDVGLAAGRHLGRAPCVPHRRRSAVRVVARRALGPAPRWSRSACGRAGSSSRTTRRGRRRRSSPPVRGIGVAVMTSTSGVAPSAPLLAEGGPLLDAEAVLLVDDRRRRATGTRPCPR